MRAVVSSISGFAGKAQNSRGEGAFRGKVARSLDVCANIASRLPSSVIASQLQITDT